ncbi:MAG: hypothetical protein FLDDKLPJ_02774 [Phycisphaerae bacterium]|nr:hypothetical protein [Phycisphaerae bacterium]
MNPPDKKSHPRKDALGQIGVGWSLVIEFLAYLGLLGYVGYRLDERYGWGGKGLMFGLMLALAGWIYRVLRVTRGIWK